jgi:DNA replication protein DnaC
MSDTPQLLLAHHLKALKLPTFLREYDKLAQQCTAEGVDYKLMIIDELGYVPLSTTGAELLFEVFSQRYERGSIIVTSNLPFDEWTGVFGSPNTAASASSKSPVEMPFK